MFEKKILREVGERLGAGGNCPFDSSCSYAGLNKCNASGETLEEMLNSSKEVINKQLEEKYGHGGIVMMVSPDIYAETWPCDCLVGIAFVSEKDKA